MIFFVYTAESNQSIRERLGLIDYSYFFVMKKFLPVLEKLGRVIVVKDIAALDQQYDALQVQGKAAVLLSFAPPHRTPIALRCPTVPVFAWEYSTIPNEAWGNDPRQNWAGILSATAGSITLSQFAVEAIQAALGPDYPVVSLPAPLWDEYAQLYRPRASDDKTWQLRIGNGVVLDSHAQGLRHSHLAAPPSFVRGPQRVAVRGVVYTAVFNPNDGRKNWLDLLSAFCAAFRDNPHATLLLKLVYCDTAFACALLWEKMQALAPYQCRVIAIQGYLDDEDYRRLVAHTTYIVNSAYGEGQCLPLMEFMAAGKPAIAANHTAMADYIDESDAFVVRFGAQWTHWPHDPRLMLRALRYRISWESMRDAYLESYRVATEQPFKYLQMAQRATEMLRAHNSRDVIAQHLTAFLAGLGFVLEPPPLHVRWCATVRRVLAEALQRNIEKTKVAIIARTPMWARKYYRRHYPQRS